MIRVDEIKKELDESYKKQIEKINQQYRRDKIFYAIILILTILNMLIYLTMLLQCKSKDK